MSEAERLQKIIATQEKELRRLRRLLSVAKVAHAEFNVEDNTLMITVSAVGVDEYYFTEQCRPELERVAEAIIREKVKTTGSIRDSVTGEEMIGGVAPQISPSGSCPIDATEDDERSAG